MNAHIKRNNELNRQATEEHKDKINETARADTEQTADSRADTQQTRALFRHGSRDLRDSKIE